VENIEEHKRAHRLKYCAEPDLNCMGICIGISVAEEVMWGQGKSHCEHFTSPVYTFMDFTFGVDRLPSHKVIMKND